MESHLLYEKQLTQGMFQVYSACPPFAVKTVKQVHSDIVVPEKEANSEAEADGIIGSSDSPLAVLTADCLPIVLMGKNLHAVIHAGWKGLQNNILGDTQIKAMNPTHAFLGPHIRVHNYEVQTDFKKNFPGSHSFLADKDQLFFDLTKEVTMQLKTFYPNIEISDCDICTFTNEHFASFRRNKTQKRNWNVFIPKGHLA